MQEKKNQQPMQNIQMMISEPHEGDLSINIVTWSGVATSEDKVEGRKLELDSWFRKDGENMLGLIYKEKRRHSWR